MKIIDSGGRAGDEKYGPESGAAGGIGPAGSRPIRYLSPAERKMMNNLRDGEDSENTRFAEKTALRALVGKTVAQTPVIDIHTHLYAPEFEKLNLGGIDELLTYHYLIAETFRVAKVAPDYFWRLTKRQRADLVWKALFLENTPISEAAMGVVTVLSELGIDPDTENLDRIRDFFRAQSASEHLRRVFQIGGVSDVVMTNDPFDDAETGVWENGAGFDRRFHAALRMDRLLNDWQWTAAKLSVDETLSDRAIAPIRNFLDRWIAVMKPLYMAVSLPDDFDYAADDARNKLIREVVLPVAREHRLPFALMVGVRRGVNPALRGAGDGVGRADLRSLEKICAENPDVRFLATYLARENQHELCVSARKFSNLMPFGCWWFLNNPSMIAEITRERLEMLGTSFIPQHSDARVLEQLIYKWRHSRRVIADVLYESYERLLDAGRTISERQVARDVTKMFSGNFREWVGLPDAGKELPGGDRLPAVEANRPL
jgi:hypothetical protein